MTKTTLLIISLSLTLTGVVAGDSIFQLRLKPIHFVPGSRMLEGMIGNENVVEYKHPCTGITEPTGLFVTGGLNYKQLLESGIKSLLFEYKNYEGASDLSAYSVFALGNYSAVTPAVLRVANKYFFGNRKMLQSVYDWAIPYYRKTFSFLTVEEQLLQKKNLLIAEKYTNMVLAQKNYSGFRSWLKQSGWREDKKITGFLARRVNKLQWTVEDCRYWISKLKADFLPLIKDAREASAHYQITDTLENDLYTAVNHIGEFTLINKTFQPVIKQYALLLRENNLVYAFRSHRRGDYRVYNLNDYTQKGVFTDFPFKEWINASPITDSSYLFYTRNYYGIYDHRNNKMLLDSCEKIFAIENTSFFIVTKQQISPGYFIHDKEGRRIGNEDINVDTSVSSPSEESIRYSLYYNIEIFFEGRLLIFRNGNSRCGAMDSTGKTVVPFKYDSINVEEKTGRIGASNYNHETEKYEEEIYQFSPTSP